MPTIVLDGPKISDLDKKRTVVREITAAASTAYGLPEETIVVVIKENPPDNVGVGGVLVADRK